MTQTLMAEPRPAGTPELPEAALAAENCLARSAPDFAEPNRLPPGSGSVDEPQTRLILQMRRKEYAARRALEDLFERGEAECLSL